MLGICFLPTGKQYEGTSEFDGVCVCVCVCVCECAFACNLCPGLCFIRKPLVGSQPRAVEVSSTHTTNPSVSVCVCVCVCVCVS